MMIEFFETPLGWFVGGIIVTLAALGVICWCVGMMKYWKASKNKRELVND